MGSGRSEGAEPARCLELESSCVSESSPTTGSERGLARFPKTSSKVNRGQSAASQVCPSSPNPGDSVAFTGISKDLADSSIPPENI